MDVTMVAPKSPGHLVRSEYEAGRGVPFSDKRLNVKSFESSV